MARDDIKGPWVGCESTYVGSNGINEGVGRLIVASDAPRPPHEVLILTQGVVRQSRQAQPPHPSMYISQSNLQYS